MEAPGAAPSQPNFFFFFFKFPPLSGPGFPGEQRARGGRCPRPRGARRRARGQLWQPLFGTRQSPRRCRGEVSEQPPREDFWFWGGFPAGERREFGFGGRHQRVFWHPEAAPGLSASSSPRGERVPAFGIAAWEGWKKPHGRAAASGNPSPAFSAASSPLLLPWEVVLGSACAGKGLS